MAATASTEKKMNALQRIFKVFKLDKSEISSIYFYAILSGLIQLSLPLGIQSIIGFVLGGSISTSLVILIFLVVIGVFIAGLLQVNQMRLIEKVQQKIFVRYSFEFADRIPKLNLHEVDSYYLPELVNRFFDTISLQKGISKLLLDIPAASIQILFGLILLSFYHPIFIVFGLVLISIIYLIIRLSGSKGLETSMKESDYKYSVASWLEEMARVVSSFKYSRNNTFHIDNTDKLVTGYLESRTSHFKILLFQYWSLIGFKVLITAGMLIVGSILLVDQQLNIGQFIAAEIVILLVINSVEKLIINLDKVYDVLTSVEKLSKVTEKPIEVNGNMDIVLQGKGLSVQMNNVSFDYQNDYKGYVLQQLNFNIQPGEKVCIMGPPGSGKSTLLRLLTGSYTSFEGSILINSTPLSNYKLSSLRAHTGILLSQQDIFHGTLLENVTMGDPTISVEQILNLAQQLKLDDFLITMKDGFNTMLEPLGKKLSRKMVHKILLLRALVNNPSLLLLEEPLENLDRNCIDNVLTYLLNCQNTVIAVSTNEQFASACSKVIYIENGSIKAIGNWSSIKNTI